MEKLKKLQKRVMVESGIAAAIVAVMFAGYMTVENLSESAQQQESQLMGEVRDIDGKIAEEERIIGIVKSSIDEFNEVNESITAGKFTLNREKAESLLTELKAKYRLDSFSAIISPETTINGQGYDGKRMAIYYSEISIDFSAMSDQHVLAFYKEFMEKASGVLRFSLFNITRDAKPTVVMLTDLSKGKVVTSVRSNAKLYWIGMKPAPKLDPAVAAAAAAAAAAPEVGE